jgi:hypothetical protein
MIAGNVERNAAEVADKPNSARISGKTVPTAVVSGRSVKPTKNKGAARQIKLFEVVKQWLLKIKL